MKLSPRARTRPSALPGKIEALNRIGPIEHVPIDQLKNYKTNPRKHPEKQLIKLMASIDEHGVAVPVLVDADFTIIAGEAVTEAARRLGLTEVPVIVARGWSPARVQGYRLNASPIASFHRLERAHVLSQASTRDHVRVHWHMLMWGLRQRKPREVIGQILRIIGASTKTVLGLVPTGNTGGANVSPFKTLPVSEDLALILSRSAGIPTDEGEH